MPEAPLEAALRQIHETKQRQSYRCWRDIGITPQIRLSIGALPCAWGRQPSARPSPVNPSSAA